jgi:hypothetical protein
VHKHALLDPQEFAHSKSVEYLEAESEERLVLGESLQENNVEIPRGLGLECLGNLRRQVLDIAVTVT